jgi:hypothetical protein
MDPSQSNRDLENYASLEDNDLLSPHNILTIPDDAPDIFPLLQQDVQGAAIDILHQPGKYAPGPSGSGFMGPIEGAGGHGFTSATEFGKSTRTSDLVLKETDLICRPDDRP